MARSFRPAVAGVPQHVVQRGNNRCDIFRDDRDRRFFLACLLEGCGQQLCEVHAYVLMTNHVHLLVTSRQEHGVARLMQSVGTRYVPHFNWRHERVGTLWQGRYKAALVDSAGYFFACSRYIELNPVRAGMVTRPGDFQWSSYRRNAEGRTDPLVRDHSLIESLGATPAERRAAYARMFDDDIDDATLGAIRDATNKGRAL